VQAHAGQGSITVPGAIAATPVEAPLDVEEGGLPDEVPIAYFHGGASPADNPELYQHLVERLARALDRRVRGKGVSPVEAVPV
jgi:polyribonucleotide 5'-hydroxyl-kinase